MAKLLYDYDNMPISASENGINFDNPFVLIRIINNSNKLGTVTMYVDPHADLNDLKKRYYMCKDIVNDGEPLLVVNDYIYNIFHDKDIYKALCLFYYKKTNMA